MAVGSTGPKRTSDELLADRARVAELLCQGWEPADVVREMVRFRASVNLSRTTVYNDIDSVRRAWLEHKEIHYDAHVAQKVAEVRQLKRTYWDEWFASKAPKETTVQAQHTSEATTPTTNGHGPNTRSLRRAEVRKEQRTGNPAYLAGVQWCIEEECRLLGLHAPERIELMFRQEVEDVARETGMDVDEVLEEANFYIRHGKL